MMRFTWLFIEHLQILGTLPHAPTTMRTENCNKSCVNGRHIKLQSIVGVNYLPTQSCAIAFTGSTIFLAMTRTRLLSLKLCITLVSRVVIWDGSVAT